MYNYYSQDARFSRTTLFTLVKKKVYFSFKLLIVSGKNDSTLREMYYIWNGFTEISQWGSPTAKMINGSDATFFATSLSRNHNIEAFTDDFQR